MIAALIIPGLPTLHFAWRSRETFGAPRSASLRTDPDRAISKRNCQVSSFRIQMRVIPDSRSPSESESRSKPCHKKPVRRIDS